MRFRTNVLLHSVLIATIIALIAGCDSDPGHAGRNSAQWIAQLDSGDVAAKTEAARALGKILAIRPDYPRVVAALVAALRDTSDVVRISAASGLTAEEVDTQAAIDGLHEVLHDSAHADVRASAVLIVSSLGPKRASALLPYLCEVLGDPSPNVRAAAVEAIGHIGPAALPEVPDLSRMMTDSSFEVRRSAVGALVNLAAPANVLLQLSRSALKDSSPNVRSAAADALRYLGTGAAPATDDLTIALRDPNAMVVRSAVFALVGIGPNARKAIPELRRLRSGASQPDQVVITEAIAILEGKQAIRGGNFEPSPIDRCRRNPADPRC